LDTGTDDQYLSARAKPVYDSSLTKGALMRILDILLLLLVAGVCGSIGRKLSGGSRKGCIVSIVLGFIGALLGMWLARVLELPMLLPLNIGGTIFPVIWSIMGSAIFVAILSFFTRRR
jgi:uncharacterized membrane protein YeaQ/YmgE (transglycosylase-associated protein family)